MTRRIAGAVVRSVVIAAMAAGPAVAQNNPFEPAPPATATFAGSFSGEGTQMTLTPDGRGGYTGAFVMNGTSYPLTATEANGGLAGQFTAGGQPFQFTAQPQPDGSIVITSGTGKRTLQRAGAAQPPAPLPAPTPNPPVQPNPPPQPNPPAGVGAGGIGLRAEPKDGKLVVAQLLPGGPADKSKVPIGGIIRAVDNKPVEGMSVEQVGQMIRGQPGTLVTVTVETANEVTDYLLQRADLSGQPGPNPPGPNPAPQPGPVAADAGVVRPGFRATWATMMVPVPGATAPLDQNEQNNWIDPQTGQPIPNFNPQPTPGNAAYQQLTIVAADQRDLAADVRTYVLTDAQSKASIAMGSTGLVAPAGGNLGDFYVPPANLARMAETPPQPGSPYTFKRIQYPMNGQTYDAMSIRMKMPQGFQHNIYDLRTGLLIVSGASMLAPQMGGGGGMNAAPQQPQLNPQQQQPYGGPQPRYPNPQAQPFPDQQDPNQQQQPFPSQQPQQPSPGQQQPLPEEGLIPPGMTQPNPGQPPQQPAFPGQQQPIPGQPQAQVVVQIMRLVEQRQLNVPWANQAAPAWLRSGQRLKYTGTMQAPGAPQPMPVSVSFAVGDARASWAPAQQEVRINGQMQGQPMQRALGSQSFDPLYIDPQVLARLQPNQVLDEDRSTQLRTTFQGLQNNAAVFVEQSPTTRNQLSYDARTGVLTSLESDIRMPTGAMQVRARLANPPQ